MTEFGLEARSQDREFGPSGRPPSTGPRMSALTLPRLLGTVRRWWAGLAALIILCGSVAFLVSAATTPIFRSTATLYFVINQGASGTDLNQGSTYAQNQMLSFAQLATSSRVVEPVIDDLGLNVTAGDLVRSVTISVPADTVILEIQVADTDPQRAAAIANGLARSVSSVVDDIAPSAAGQAPTVRAELINAATAPRSQASPNKPRDTGLGIALGLALAVACTLAITLLDTRLRNAAAVESAVGAALLGTLPQSPSEGIDRLPVLRQPLGSVAEDLRRLRTALSFAGVAHQAKRILVTSAVPREGKSSLSTNLAPILAETGDRVLLIDADLRRPQVSERYGVEGAVGLTSVLTGAVSLDTAVVSRGGTLDLLTSGAVPPNPAELLASAAMSTLLDEASQRYDFVIVDSPPVLSVADANVLAPMTDGVVLVIDGSRTRESHVRNARRLLDSSGAVILGVVLNRTSKLRKRHSYYGSITTEVEAESSKSPA